jgi:colicin import membrane protein
MKHVLIPALLFVAMSQVAADSADERRRMSQQRADIEARFAQESQACLDRFIVNACLDDARARRVASLKPLQTREDALDAAERRERAQAQRDRVAQKELEFAAEELRRSTALQARPAASAASSVATTQPDPRTPRASTQTHGQAVQAELALVEREALRRREQAAARQLAQQQQLQERQAQSAGKTPAPPLPVPTAAEVARVARSASGAGSAPAR